MRHKLEGLSAYFLRASFLVGNGVPSLRAISRILPIVRSKIAAARSTVAPPTTSAFRRSLSSSVQGLFLRDRMDSRFRNGAADLDQAGVSSARPDSVRSLQTGGRKPRVDMYRRFCLPSPLEEVLPFHSMRQFFGLRTQPRCFLIETFRKR